MSEVILRPESYLGSQAFEDETLKIFKLHWLFGCFTSDLPHSGDFSVKKFPFGEVVIRNFEGEIKAFFNICSHRFSKLFLSTKGNSKIVCPYHGWRYDNEGKVSVVPLKKDCFGDDFVSEKFMLQFLDLEICGKFIFIRVPNKNGMSLREFLGAKYEALKSYSDFMSARIEENQMNINANWKLIIENSLEEYHLLSVHSETLAKILGSKIKVKYAEYSSASIVQLLDSSHEKIKKLYSFFERRLDRDHYQHDFIFPNLAVASTNGISFFIQEALPDSPSQTTYVSHGFVSEFKSNSSESVTSHLTKQFVETNRKVFLEDSEICEGIQIALKAPVNLPGKLGNREMRIMHFHDLYQKTLGK